MNNSRRLAPNKMSPAILRHSLYLFVLAHACHPKSRRNLTPTLVEKAWSRRVSKSATGAKGYFCGGLSGVELLPLNFCLRAAFCRMEDIKWGKWEATLFSKPTTSPGTKKSFPLLTTAMTPKSHHLLETFLLKDTHISSDLVIDTLAEQK